MISSGIRIGAYDCWKFKHIAKLKDVDGKIIATKIIVYANEPEQYLIFISAEACLPWIECRDYRASYGEKITSDSWAMRDLWKQPILHMVLNWVMRKLL